MNGKSKGPIYTSFLGLPDDAGIEVHPIAYSHLAFTQGLKAGGWA
jgi:hypothetical protein